MTDLRTAAQQALEAMSSFESGTNGLYEGEFAEEISALRAALVEDAMQKFTDVNQELQAALGCDHCNHPMYAATRCRVCGRETPIIEPEIKGDNKPVAWIYQNANTDREYLVWRKSEGGRNWRPLYTAPPQHKPLTHRAATLSKPSGSLGEDVLECPNCASLQNQNTELDRKLAEMERKLSELQAAIFQSQGIRD